MVQFEVGLSRSERMGDFEDIFGVGADIESIIDGICADEVRPEIVDDVVDHFLWFPTYAAAEEWERAHRGTPFTRRPHLGGFEVTLRDRRSSAERWRISSLPPGSMRDGKADDRIELVHAVGLDGREVAHGGFRVRLAKDTSSLLVDVLAQIRAEVPPGRAAMSPITLSTKQFYAFFRCMPVSVSHDLDLGMGVMAIFCEDHHLLVGRRVSKAEMQILPWILEMKCAGGRAGTNAGRGCFLCDHHEVEEGRIPSNTYGDLGDYPADTSATRSCGGLTAT